MKTAVIFICHQVCGESIFRFNQLKEATDELGYDLTWVLDQDFEKETPVPPGTKTFMFSFKECIEKIPFMVYAYGQNDIKKSPKKINVTPCATAIYHLKNRGKYDRLWVFEYDVCYMGKWKTFFQKYDQVDCDLISGRPCHKVNNPHNHDKWVWFKQLSPAFKNKVYRNKHLYISFNYCCRLSSRLLDDIVREHKTTNNNQLWFEWSWATIAHSKGYNIVPLDSNNISSRPIGEDFQDYLPDTPYHAIKLNVNWKDKMNRYLGTSK